MRLLLERINHVEGTLASSLFGLLITTTIAVAGGAYTVRESTKKTLKPYHLMLAVNVLYITLSGYYYFMLTHFYSAATLLIKTVSCDKSAEMHKLTSLFAFFKVPSLGVLPESWQRTLYLVNAPLVPLLVTLLSVVVTWSFMRRDLTVPGRGVLLAACLSLHVVFALIMIYLPFTQFVEAINSAIR